MKIEQTLLGYLRVATCVPKVWTGNVKANIQEHKIIMSTLDSEIRLVVFPEMSLTGYTCADLFLQEDLRREVMVGIEDLKKFSLTVPFAFIVGAPVGNNNSAILFWQGQYWITGKKNLPEYGEFYEKRWFTEDTTEEPFIFEVDGVKIGLEICEDLWVPCPPCEKSVVQGGAEIIVNLSASPRLSGKYEYLQDLIKITSARLQAGYLYVSSGPWESSTDLVFSGWTMAYEDGKCIRNVPEITSLEDKERVMITDFDIHYLRAQRRKNKLLKNQPITEPKVRIDTRHDFDSKEKSEYRVYDPYPFLKPMNYPEVFAIQSLGLQRRLKSTGEKVVVGVSGGTDSTLALLVAVDAMDKLGLPRTNIIGVTMPCFGTTGKTYRNSLRLMTILGVTSREVNIKESVTAHLKEIDHPLDVYDIAYENAQARLRTQTLFDISNMEGAIVLGTGDLSELALGWCTYGADHLSSYNPNVSIPKTLVIELIRYYRTNDQDLIDCLFDIRKTPISPELLPPDEKGKITQISEDTVGPYELHDYFLYHYLKEGMSEAKIVKTCFWAFSGDYTEEEIWGWYNVFKRRFRSQQFKRSCLPDGPKTGCISLSPRGDWRMPSDLLS